MEEKEDKILLALRKSNGQIGYLSKGITIPEFFELTQPKNNVTVLIDFHPIIDKLYNLHYQSKNENIYMKYHSLYTYFLDIQTYTINNNNKWENAIDKANSFIHLIKVEINEIKKNFYSNTNEKCSIEKLCELSNLFIDAILIFIYSKASLEIKSLKQDTILTDYIKYLKNIIYDFYKRFADLNRGLIKSNFIMQLLFTNEKELSNHLNIIEGLNDDDKNINNIKLKIFNEAYKNNYYNHMNENIQMIFTEYREITNDEIYITTLLMETLHKINSVNKLLYNLKNNEVEFENNENHIEEIKQLINN
ncbi:hypothetical protein ACMC56_04320 [Campylobacterota bacterium DY0563]